MARDLQALHVAIIGGGLCGLALAIALERRKIEYTIYEARASFTEIGAGLNLAPNAIHSFNAIDSDLYDNIFALATRNAEGREDVWMEYRLGAPTASLGDGHLVGELFAPPTGNMTVSRNEILQLLARSIPENRKQFNKKLSSLSQDSDEVSLTFADGTTAVSPVVIGCDGVHSTVRVEVLGPRHPAREPVFSGTGGYRAVFSKEEHREVVGTSMADASQIFCGPGGYVIMYPINEGKNVNIGVWMRKEGPWTEKGWVLKRQKGEMKNDIKDWGETVQRITDSMSDDTEFWAAFYHALRPEHYFTGRACFIGDAAHSMPPHQGQGASQAMEDVVVMAGVLQRLHELRDPNTAQVRAAFLGFEAARKKRFEDVAQSSHEAHAFWESIWQPDRTEDELSNARSQAVARFAWLWNEGIDDQQLVAVGEMHRLLEISTKSYSNGHPR